MNRQVLVTGATGFVGTALISRLIEERRFLVGASVRKMPATPIRGVAAVSVNELSSETDWRSALTGCSLVIHLAARVHIPRDKARDPLEEFRRVNVAGTLNLARQAAATGVSRFVFLSSAKVFGDKGLFSDDDVPAPADPYSVSKLEAESGLRQIGAETGMEIVIVRPPLVYGAGVKANVHALIRVLERGLPLPLGSIHNRRSFLAIDNLVDFVVTCVEHPAAANQSFLVTDKEDLSTTDLVRRLAAAMGIKARLLSVPSVLLQAAATLSGRAQDAHRLLWSLQFDSSKATRLLGWSPVVSVEEGLRRAVVK